MVNFKLLVEDLLVEKRKSPPTNIQQPPVNQQQQPTATPIDQKTLLEILQYAASKNGISNDENILKNKIALGIKLGQGSKSYVTKENRSNEAPFYPIVDLLYAIYKNCKSESRTTADFANLTINDIAITYGITNLKFIKDKVNLLLSKKFDQYTQKDFTYTGFDLGLGDLSALVITQYSNSSIYNTLTQVAKTKAESLFSAFTNKSNFANVILYPIDYASGKYKMKLQDNELLSCSSAVLSWYKKAIITNGVIDKPEFINMQLSKNDLDITGTYNGRNTPFGIDYSKFLNGTSELLLDEHNNSLITNVKSCESIAPEIYNAIKTYVVSIKHKKQSVNKTELAKQGIKSLAASGWKNLG